MIIYTLQKENLVIRFGGVQVMGEIIGNGDYEIEVPVSSTPGIAIISVEYNGKQVFHFFIYYFFFSYT